MAGRGIVQVISGQAWSGGQQQALHLAAGLAARGHRLRLVCREGSVLADRARARGLDVETVPLRRSLDRRLIASLLRLTREGFEVIDVHRPQPLVAAELVRRLRPGVVVVATRRVSFPISSRLSARFKFDRWLDGVTAVSEGVREALEKSGVRPEKIRVIYGAVDGERFRPGIDPTPVRREWAIEPGEQVALVVANYLTWKGHDWFLSLLPRVRQVLPGLRVLLLGKGTEGPALRRSVGALGLEKTVTGVGFRDDVENFLAAADLLVSPSLGGEGLTGAVREAMAMGVPVIATSAGGNGEIVIPGQTGRLIPPGSDEEMVEALRATFAEPSRTREMAERARALVLDRFGIERMVGETVSFYEELLARRGKRAL